VVAVFDTIFLGGTGCGAGTNFSFLQISGFSVDPGQDWLSSITCNGVKNDGSGATLFSYSSGKAIWEWSQVFGLMANNGSNVSCTISHS
jgi:hypothetical protein